MASVRQLITLSDLIKKAPNSVDSKAQSLVEIAESRTLSTKSDKAVGRPHEQEFSQELRPSKLLLSQKR
jgi:hypothetical protein